MLLSTYLEAHIYAEVASHSWRAAARIYYDLRRKGLTVRSSIDCCIAQIALENDLVLVRDDRGFKAIAQAAKGEVQTATEERDAAMKALKAWLSDYRAISKIALEAEPQQLEALGILQR